jgi:small multidrug resistance pump
MGWAALCGAIAAEIVGTLSLRGLASGWRWSLGLAVILGYGVSFALLAMALRTVPVSTAYAVWSGLGIVGITLLAMLLYGERVSPSAALGIVLIIVGVVALKLNGTAHG